MMRNCIMLLRHACNFRSVFDQGRRLRDANSVPEAALAGRDYLPASLAGIASRPRQPTAHRAVRPTNWLPYALR